MEKSEEKNGILGELLLSVGVGGLITCYLIRLCEVKLIVHSEHLNEIVTNGRINEMSIGLLETCIFVVSIFVLLLAPLLSKRYEHTGIKIFVLLILICLDAIGIAVVAARGEIFPAFIIVMWISSVYITWIGFGILKIIYSWIKIEKKTISLMS